jgi:hypothetical protein
MARNLIPNSVLGFPELPVCIFRDSSVILFADVMVIRGIGAIFQ